MQRKQMWLRVKKAGKEELFTMRLARAQQTQRLQTLCAHSLYNSRTSGSRTIRLVSRPKTAALQCLESARRKESVHVQRVSVCSSSNSMAHLVVYFHTGIRTRGRSLRAADIISLRDHTWNNDPRIPHAFLNQSLKPFINQTIPRSNFSF